MNRKWAAAGLVTAVLTAHATAGTRDSGAAGQLRGRQGGDTCESAFVIPSLPFSDTGTTVGYTNDYDEPCPTTGGTAPDVVYAYTPTTDLVIDISLCTNSDYDTRLYVYMDACTAGTAIACNDDSCSTPSFPAEYVSHIMGVPLAAGHTYYLVVDGYDTAAGNYTLDIPYWPPIPSCAQLGFDGQSPHFPWEPWNALTSAQTSAFNFLCYDNCASIPAAVRTVAWFGLSLLYNQGWSDCDPTGMTFEIKFYPDAGGLPGTPVCAYTVTPSITDLGVLYSGFPMFMFEIPLLPPCGPLPAGWISIQSLPNARDCAFLWLSGVGGDGLAYQRDVSSGGLTALDYDLSFCLASEYTPIYGACCDDVAGTCTDDVAVTDCLPPQRFAANTLCASLNPPCGQIPGACCHPDGTCEIVLQSECTYNWLGAYTVCSECPCIVICPEGAIPEPEDCGNDMDGGCNMPGAPYFAAIAPGNTVCGTYWADTGMRDTDWYSFTNDESNTYTWTVRGTSPIRAFIIDGNVGCDPPLIVGAASGAACEDVSVVSDSLPPGTYWFWAGSAEFVDYPCPQSYVATLTAEPCCIPLGACCQSACTCTSGLTEAMCAAIGGMWLGPDTTCDPNPCVGCCDPNFLVVAPGSWAGNTCGAGNNCPRRPSEDLTYQVEIPQDGTWHFDTCGADWDTYIYVGTGVGGMEVGADDDGCTATPCCCDSALTATIPAGMYYVLIEGYLYTSCGDFELHVFAEQPCIPECPAGSVPEGEPRCGPEYVDTYNGGCDSAPPVFQPIADGMTYCGETGTYTVDGVYRYDIDCFEITVAQQSIFHFTVESEFPRFAQIRFGLLEQVVPGFAGCDNLTGQVNPSLSHERCTPGTVTTECLPGGTYYFFVAPAAPDPGVACGTRYTASLAVEGCVIPIGACCFQSGGCMAAQTEEQCAAQTGRWQGAGTVCGPNPCIPFYCPAGSATCDEYIGNVIVGDFSNPSECGEGGYTDFTYLCISMASGVSYDIEVDNPVPYGADQCGIWIDWNHDHVFDAGEFVAMNGSPGGGPYTATIVPPPDATTGNTTMRIRVMYTGALDPCGVAQYGEVEDYCITVPAICGDFDHTGHVDVDDYWLLFDAFGTCADSPKFLAAADFDGDGCITLVDYQAWVRCYEDANGGTAFQPPARRPAAPRPGGSPRGDN